jgi:hypothetical protein
MICHYIQVAGGEFSLSATFFHVLFKKFPFSFGYSPNLQYLCTAVGEVPHCRRGTDDKINCIEI